MGPGQKASQNRSQPQHGASRIGQTDMTRCTLASVPAMVRKRAEFNANGSLRGESGYHYGTGRMVPQDREIYSANRDRIVYTVVSYATPVAWIYDDGTHFITDNRYSVTTARHVGRIRLGLS